MSETVNPLYTQLIAAIGEAQLSEQLLFNEPLRKYTTWRVGGPADLFVEVKSAESLVTLVNLARKHAVPFFLLGGGSNVLIGDKGFRGIVLRATYQLWEVWRDKEGNDDQKKVYEELKEVWGDHVTGEYRHVQVHYTLYKDTEDPSYLADQVFLRVSAGYSMASLIRGLLDAGLTGLEKFSRIPGTLGGWIYNNAHGHTLFIGDFIHEVRCLTENGEVVNRSWKELDFGYDQSVFHNSNEVILDAVLRVFRGNAELAKQIAVDVMKAKMLRQPSNSGGCVFHNLTKEEVERNNFETDAAGYVVDKKLGWLGTQRVGGAWISSKHGNFIETDENATAADILAVMQIIKDECKKRYNVELKDEVFRVGEF